MGSGWYPNGTTCYLYDGRRVIQERNSGGTPTVSYTRGDDLSGGLQGAGGIGGLLARSSGYSGGNWSTHYYYHADGGGNITYLMDSSQAMAATYKYDPFGNILSSSGTQAGANVYRFSSKEMHVNSGLYYYGFRFYDPNLQRWLNRDPVEESGGVNLYRFVANSPVFWFDTDGDGPVPQISGFTYEPGGKVSVSYGRPGQGTSHEQDAILKKLQSQLPPPRPPCPTAWAPDAGGIQSDDNVFLLALPLPKIMLPCKVPMKAPNLDKLADDILHWVGPKSTLEKPPGGSDLIIRSADATKQIRFDLTNPHGLDPHINVETFKPRDLFPGDKSVFKNELFHC